jgi:Cu2+-exporting ATPase
MGGTCHHCGETLSAPPIEAIVEGVARSFCCNGCAGAARWITDANLQDYYRLRSQAGARVGTQMPDMSLWDRDDLLKGHTREMDGGREITVLADGMHCAACAWLIDRATRREPGVLEVNANAITGRIRLVWNPTQVRLSQLLGRLAALGYRPFLATGEVREKARRQARNRDLIRIGVAGIGAMQAMMFAEALYLDFNHTMTVPTRDFLRWITFLVATPVVFWAGWPFMAGMLRELRHRRLGMDTLIAGSTLLAWAASVWGTLTGAQHVWYDAAVMFVFLLLVARQLEQRARGIASAQVDALARARPAFAMRENADGTREPVPLDLLAVGDVVRVAVGETVPADGVLLDADGSFEEALLTGEARAVDKHAGDTVYAGTACHQHAARVRVEQVGDQTRLAELARLVERAQSERPALARSAETIASYFVVSLLLVALLVYLGWRSYEPARAFEVVLALLVVSCPCALSLAIPTALAAAHGALARLGVLAVREGALERMATVTDIVFDKTGTLSDARPQLESVQAQPPWTDAAALRVAAALERESHHPLAAAFVTNTDVPSAQAVRAYAGQGIEGEVEGALFRLGRADFAVALDDDGAVWLGGADGRRARFTLAERERPDAAPALTQLKSMGMHLHLSSGDAAARVQAFADRLGITQVQARQSPEAKLAYARSLQAHGRIVAMVGDGLNDAPVLAGADVSFALGEGAALAHRAADLVTTTGSLMRIPAAIQLARRTRRIIRQNLAWAIGYNVLALPLAAAGWVTPWLAALGMALSSLAVTLNALRLTRTPSAATTRAEPSR